MPYRLYSRGMEPDAPSSPLPIDALVEDLLRSTGHLLRRLRVEANPGELSWSQAMVLGRLARDGARTTADLARAERVRPQSMGATMTALEREGLVARRPHPTDGRQALYELTEAGTATLEERRLMKRAWLGAALATLDEADRRALDAALAILDRLAQG